MGESSAIASSSASAGVAPAVGRQPRKPFRAIVQRIDSLTYDIKQIRFSLIDPPVISFSPGQNIRLQCPPYGNNPQAVARNYSISSIPSDCGGLEIIVRKLPGGVCTTWIFEVLQEGDEVSFTGPYGRFALSAGTGEMIWVAGGSGLGVFWSMIRHMKEKGIVRPCACFFGAVARDDLYLLEEMRQKERELRWFRFVPALSGTATDDDWAGERGLITEVVRRQVPFGTAAEAYLCGPSGMIDAAVEVLAGKGIGPERIFQDRFTLPDEYLR